MALTATVSRSKAEREQFQWNAEAGKEDRDELWSNRDTVEDSGGGAIALKPREIRTFLINSNENSTDE
eukprot:m.209560 g.209560  ORF g.209560 m.209560 type:complete len:68 (+) comp39727_c0_seq49:3805-4008(+)